MTVQWALAYGRIGWRSFPLRAGQKRPIYDKWPEGATTDPELIGRYFRDETRNIGVVCGEAFDAWDIEAEHLDRFHAWLWDIGVHLPEAPLAKTARGGIHYLTAPTGVDGTRHLFLGGVHIGELKSRGGFIVVAPSRFEESGGEWRWMWKPEGMAVPEAPAWLLALLERPSRGVHRFPSRIASVEQGVRRLTVLATAVREAGEGRRNNYLYWAMRRALEEGIPAKYAGEALLETAREAGLDDHEARATLRSAYDAEGVAA